jgi:hypothetical protein
LRKITEVAVTLIVVIVAAGLLLIYFNYGSGTLEIKLRESSNDRRETTQVYLNCSEIEIHQAQASKESGWLTVLEKSAWIDLTRVLDINRTIGYADLRPGSYDLIRFKILDARVVVGEQNLTASVIPNDEMIAAISSGIHVNTGRTTKVLIEIKVNIEEAETDNLTLIPTVKAEEI